MRLLPSKLFSNTDSKTIAFVFGCQRSGTTMLINLINQAPKVSLYREGNPKVMENYRIKDSDTIKRIINKDKNKFLIFKPVNDLQQADHLLSIFPNTKAIWIYRNYNAVINSAVTKWQDAQKRIVLWIKDNYGKENIEFSSNNEDSQYATYIENIKPDTVNTIKELANGEMTNEDGAALLWYIRNKIYFELNLQSDERVRLINYENLVTNPDEKLKDVFDFIGCGFSSEYTNKVRTSSVNKQYSFKLNPKIDQICSDMLKKFNDQYSN